MPRSDIQRHLPLTHLGYFLLLVLADAPGHGYALVQRIRERSGGLVDPGTGSFYAIVGQFVDERLLAETAPAAGEDARRRVYAIAGLGRRVLAAEAARLAAAAADARRTLRRPIRSPR